MSLGTFISVAALTLFSGLLLGQTALADDASEFATCVTGLQAKARAAGLSPETVDTTVAQLRLVPRVLELDRKQPEFSQTFGNYFNQRVTDWRVAEGRRLLAEHKPLLARLTAQHGVPAQYLLAFWGLETNFGRYKGKMPVLDSLATLACDPRRSDYFTSELIQALKLKERYGFESKDMVGSWAGAMGHTQFMPSAYGKYALDGDGDGRADLWHSTEDALTSAANFLQHLGWKRDERWGREVLLPEEFDYRHLGRQQAQPLSEWAKLKLKRANGRSLPTADMRAALYVPAGHTGPAFLGYDNFEVIMRWNRSAFYAIAVGHLADRIVGAAPLTVRPPEQPRLSRERVKQLQAGLNLLGFQVGEPDGVLGRNTVTGIQAFQRSRQLIADGYPGEETLQALATMVKQQTAP
ncbi:lytic murein transglycosylase [Shewanella salipaludis]|uniref:Lytic murein transglycosylase n=1 Tax=Shewanella salipaludis TaxID=2723052 RepID=A0A972JJU9_9GAMM|nr:lytic murein transglycosylase [Shewanella salipaludis]